MQFFSIETELVEIPEMGINIIVNYDLYSEDAGIAKLIVNVNWPDTELPPENKPGMIEAEITNLELFKKGWENDHV